MTRWQTAFETAQLRQNVGACLTLLEAAKIDILTPNDLAEYARLAKVLKILESRFARLDPEMCNPNVLNTFVTWLNAIQTHISHFATSQNIGHLHNANNTVDEILMNLHQGGTFLVGEDIRPITEATETFTRKVIEELKLVTSQADEVKSQLGTLSNLIDLAQGRLAEHDQTIQSQKTRLDQITSEFQKQFTEAQGTRATDSTEAAKQRQEEFSAQIKTFDNGFTATIESQKKEHEAVLNETRKVSAVHLDFLNGREAEVNRIFGAIGSTSFAGNFKTTADTESTAANLWRWIALGLMGTMTIVGIVAFYFSIAHDTDWKLFAFRLGTVGVLAIPAIYAANESSKHRERERLNRKIHLELASIDAYLVLLPEVQRHKLKGELTEKFFGVQTLKEKADEVSQKDLFSLLSTALNNLTKGR